MAIKRMKFQLLRGRHRESSAKGTKVYVPGEIVVSPFDLVKKFGKTKFAFEGDVDPNAPAPVEILPKADAEPATEEKTENVPAPASRVIAVHKGRGKYNVVYEDTGEAVNDSLLSKLEANDIVLEMNRTLEDAE